MVALLPPLLVCKLLEVLKKLPCRRREIQMDVYQSVLKESRLARMGLAARWVSLLWSRCAGVRGFVTGRDPGSLLRLCRMPVGLVKRRSGVVG